METEVRQRLDDQHSQTEKLQKRVEALERAVGALLTCLVRTSIAVPNVDYTEPLGLRGIGCDGIPPKALAVLQEFSAEARKVDG